MDPVTIRAVVGEDRQLIISLPEDFPIGPVLVTITPVPEVAEVRLIDEYGEEIVQLPPGAPDTSQLIEEGRRPR